MSSSLFRTAVMKGHGPRRYGEIVLPHQVGHSLLVALFVAITCGLLLFFATCDYQRKAQVAGVVVPAAGLIRVTPVQNGLVSRRMVDEGQAVRAGDILFSLVSQRNSATGDDAEKAISALIQSRRQSFAGEREQLLEQSRQRIETLERRSDDLAGDVARIDAQMTLQQRRVALAEQALERHTRLEAQGFIASAQVQDKQSELLDQRQRLGDLERARASQERELAAAKSELKDQRIQARRDQGAASRNIASLDQELTENDVRRETVIRAPQDGVIAAVNAEVGFAVAAGQVLGSIVPRDTPLIVELYAPSRAAGFIKPGMDVMVRYQSYPYQKFGQHHGRVKVVSQTALRSDEIGASAIGVPSSGEPLYRVRVELDAQAVTAYGTLYPLKSGMALEAHVLLEKRRLYEWVLEPLLTITGRL